MINLLIKAFLAIAYSRLHYSIIVSFPFCKGNLILAWIGPDEIVYHSRILFQFLDERPDGLGGVEVLGFEFVDADLYAEDVVDFADDGNDVKGVENAFVDEFGLVLEVHVGANAL
jgi:hypothetical protein